ncbi:hypothetical protein PO909_034088 [Leuciscus waleckii]
MVMKISGVNEEQNSEQESRHKHHTSTEREQEHRIGNTKQHKTSNNDLTMERRKRLLYLSIVIIDKGVIQNVSRRNPTPLLRTVTFPVHQVLDSASPPPRVQNTIYRISRFPIYEAGEEPGLAG